MAVMICAPRPGLRTICKIDARTDEKRQRDDSNIIEIREELAALTHDKDNGPRCEVAKKGFESLLPYEQQYLKSLVHLSARLCLLVTVGDWAKASEVLTNIAASTSEPKRSHELAIRLAVFERNGLEDARQSATAHRLAA